MMFGGFRTAATAEGVSTPRAVAASDRTMAAFAVHVWDLIITFSSSDINGARSKDLA